MNWAAQTKPPVIGIADDDLDASLASSSNVLSSDLSKKASGDSSVANDSETQEKETRQKGEDDQIFFDKHQIVDLLQNNKDQNDGALNRLRERCGEATTPFVNLFSLKNALELANVFEQLPDSKQLGAKLKQVCEDVGIIYGDLNSRLQFWIRRNINTVLLCDSIDDLQLRQLLLTESQKLVQDKFFKDSNNNNNNNNNTNGIGGNCSVVLSYDDATKRGYIAILYGNGKLRIGYYHRHRDCFKVLLTMVCDDFIKQASVGLETDKPLPLASKKWVIKELKNNAIDNCGHIFTKFYFTWPQSEQNQAKKAFVKFYSNYFTDYVNGYVKTNDDIIMEKPVKR